jgi:hypothetical protein
MTLSRRLCLPLMLGAVDALSTLSVQPARAVPSVRRHALLIGVADYPNLPRRLWLRGPVNDVQLISRALQSLGYATEDAQVLHSRAGADREPTLANIRQAMERLARQVRAGDRVVFHLSGHGSRVPQPPGAAVPEADGMEEVFLPADVSAWAGGDVARAIPNALYDDEIGAWIDRLVDTGATVWAFFDACHAAGLVRARGGAARVRAVAPAELGLQVRAAAPVALASSGTPPSGGGHVFVPPRTDGRMLCFAARGAGQAAEELLPRGAGMAARIHGVMSFELARALVAGATDAVRLSAALRAAYREAGRGSDALPVVAGDARIAGL